MSLSKEEQHDLDIYKKNDLLDPQIADLFINFCYGVIGRNYENRHFVLDVAHKVRDDILNEFSTKLRELPNDRAAELNDIYWKILLMEARNRQIDAYFLYLEKNREPKEKFYQPKRKMLMKHGIIDGFQGLIDDNLDILCISMPPGTGKAQPLYSKVLTPTGFKRMGDIHVGDKVIDGNGCEASVIGVYPQGVKPIYELTLDDGSKCRCSDEHLWTVQTIEDRKKNIYRTIETKQMLHNFKRNLQNNYSIDYIPEIDFDESELKIHPYVLGVLLGDGCYTRKNIGIASPDKQIIEKIEKNLPDGYTISQHAKYNYGLVSHNGGGTGNKGIMRRYLEEYGLFGKYGHEKFIPEQYLYSSYQSRIELLRGLLDTDGSVGKNGYDIEFSSTSKLLAYGVRELVHSLGGYASISVMHEARESEENGKIYNRKKAYRVVIEFVNNNFNPFYVDRKADRFRPKTRGLKRFISNIEYVGEDECQCIMLDSLCHLYITDDYIITHNTTAEKFFHSGVMGWFPKDYSLFYSHSGDITRMYYDGVYQILSDSQEYTWNEIFPSIKITSTNAKSQQINVSSYKAFPSLQTASVGSENAGKVRASKFLLVDDMIGKLEEALNKNILDKLWAAYSVDARQRKTKGADGKFCKEIHIATRWSVHDVIGRIQRAYEGNDRVKCIAIPDIDPKTGESNFLYDYGGFTVQDFKDQELLMDDISYRCLYKQDPIEREGLLYHPDEIRTYSSLPLTDPDEVVGVCDTKNTGTDFMVLPCFYRYGDDFYLVDCVCDNSVDFDVLFAKMTSVIMENGLQRLEIESNIGGKPIGTTLRNMLEERKYDCNITEKPTETNKEARIIANSYWVKKHVLFKEKGDYTPRSDYGVFMGELFTWTQVGKNKHDDVPDALANFALFIQNAISYRPAVVRRSPI